MWPAEIDQQACSSVEGCLGDSSDKNLNTTCKVITDSLISLRGYNQVEL